MATAGRDPKIGKIRHISTQLLTLAVHAMYWEAPGKPRKELISTCDWSKLALQPKWKKAVLKQFLDTAGIAQACDEGRRVAGVPLKKKSRRRNPALPRIFTRDDLDQRTVAAKTFEHNVSNIAADLGGVDTLSTIQKRLIEAFAGIWVGIDHLNARILAGERIDILEHSTAISTLVRVASRLGLRRIPRNVQSLDDYLSQQAIDVDDNEEAAS